MATNASAPACLNDASLGPAVVGCRDDFDFTVVFEQSILSILPSALFEVLALARIWQLHRKPAVVSGRKLQFLKSVSILPAKSPESH